MTLGTNYGYAKNKNYYSTAKRLVQASSWIKGGTGPSLICPNDNNGGKLSKFTVNDTIKGNGALKNYTKIGLLTADEIAEEAEFFSFGTNDLTQMTFGFSRDDTGKIIKEYREKGIFDDDPFQSIDQVGVGKLVKMAVELGKQTRPSIKLGICGEHGGDPKSIEFCNAVGLQYVSCSPFRVPIARLAAAQAAIKQK